VDDREEGARNADERAQGVAIEVCSAFCHFAKHDGGTGLVLANERGEASDDLVELFGGGSCAGGDRAEAVGGEGEMAAQERAIELLLAAEVVVEHGLVDAGATGDAVDAGAGKAALGELGGGGGEDAVGGDAGAAGHDGRLADLN